MAGDLQKKYVCDRLKLTYRLYDVGFFEIQYQKLSKGTAEREIDRRAEMDRMSKPWKLNRLRVMMIGDVVLFAFERLLFCLTKTNAHTSSKTESK
jgi:hypothetical protein